MELFVPEDNLLKPDGLMFFFLLLDQDNHKGTNYWNKQKKTVIQNIIFCSISGVFYRQARTY